MLHFTTGDMFETPADIRVNTVNCVGVMGKGVALAFKSRYPEMFRDYKRACDSGDVQPGKLHVWKNLTGEWIINFPTKRHWKEKSRYEDIEAGLRALHGYLSDKGQVKVALPALGCGHGGLDWSRVSEMIRKHLNDLPAEFIVFEPADSRAVGDKVKDEEQKRWVERLESHGIHILKGAGISSCSTDLEPETVFFCGDGGLLRNAFVSFAMSAHPDEREKDATLACVDELAKKDVVLSFNYDELVAPVIERALSRGSRVVVWVAEGLMNFKVPDYWKQHLDKGEVTVASVATPHQRAKPGIFERTQATSLKMGRVGIITEPRPRWISSDPKTLDEWLDKKLFYLRYQDTDQITRNSLNRIAAKPIGRNPETKKPNVAPIREFLTNSLDASKDFANVLRETFQTETTPKHSVPDKKQYTEATSATVSAVENKKMSSYPKRLIEVDLPIKRISAHARREKSIRHGHISTLHIWWARRPLAACRAVICASLWPDPADPICPPAFREASAKIILEFARKITTDTTLANDHCSPENFKALARLLAQPSILNSQPAELRSALLDFIADFANWDNSTIREYLDTSRALTQAAHEALGGAPGTRPLVVDPFAGGGAIPLEALRVGADAFASDLNPLPVLLNKALLEYIPQYGQSLADEVRKWGEWIKREAEKELSEFYPNDADGATPIAYLWARTIQCEGPGCGAEVPLIRSLWLAKKANRSVALQLIPDKKAKRVDFQVIVKLRDSWVDQANQDIKIESPKLDGTVKRGSVTCPFCDYTTPVTRIREQIKSRRGGSRDARLLAIVATRDDGQARFYRAATEKDATAATKAAREIDTRQKNHKGDLSLLPDEPLPPQGTLGFRLQPYGFECWADIFTPRQQLLISTLGRLVKIVGLKEGEAVQLLLCFALGRTQDLNASTSTWANTIEAICGANRAQNRMPMVWDFVEANALGEAGGNWLAQVEWVAKVVEHVVASACGKASIEQSPAQEIPLPSDSADALVTDPPYYDAFGYSDLSDFFLSWHKRHMPASSLSRLTFSEHGTSPKKLEIVVNPSAEKDGRGPKDANWFESQMSVAFAKAREVVKPEGVAVVVFAHKQTSGWEALLSSVINSGWIVSGSWPIDTERPARQRAQDSAALASSIHLVCRPRENPDGSVRTNEIGDWRDVLQELPRRIHEWMPRLAEEGVVGADAIFACLGPALEIFSRYSRVEKASGEIVTLKEYLEQVWAAVAKEALAQVFKDADTSALEPDARLTAMWLWTLNANSDGNQVEGESDDENEPDDEEEKGGKGKVSGFVLEYDAARKIAQGLGAHLENLASLVEVIGDSARLLPVSERSGYLFGKDQTAAPASGKKKKAPQTDFFSTLMGLPAGSAEAEAAWGEKTVSKVGETTLDRIHQSMILFAASRSEAMKRFLVEDGAGSDPRFWRLAQALSALYPARSEEKRWVDGVLARKKGLGF